MNEIEEISSNQIENLKSLDVGNNDQNGDVRQENGTIATEPDPKLAEGAVPKKRKTRRGKSKRKMPYHKYGGKNHNNKVIKHRRIVKPEAPHNDNQFLLEDHGGFAELDEHLKNIDQPSTSTVARTRESSFSVDSDGEEFYSSPDDEGEFLMQDFMDQYQSVQTEQLYTMNKQELIEEYLALDKQTSQKNRDLEETIQTLEKEVERHKLEKEALQRENDLLKSKLEQAQNNKNSDSEDSETDSSDSCSSSTTASSSGNSHRSRSPLLVSENLDLSHTNGHV